MSPVNQSSSLILNVMQPLVRDLCLYLPFILCLPSILLTIIAVWIIQKKSPQSMQGYKKYLIAITVSQIKKSPQSKN